MLHRTWIALGLALSLVLAQAALAMHDVRHHSPHPVSQCELCTAGPSLTASAPDNTPVFPLAPVSASPMSAAAGVAAQPAHTPRARGPPHLA